MSILMVALLAWQVFMPQVNNGHYQIVSDGTHLYRMDTQDGTTQIIPVPKESTP